LSGAEPEDPGRRALHAPASRALVAILIATVAPVILLGCEDEEKGAGQEPPAANDLGLLEKDTLIVGSEIPFPPFEEGDPPGYEGFDIDVINAVADELELEAQIQNVPLNSILAGDTSELDLSISAVRITPARDKRVDFSNPYFIDFLSLLVRDDSAVQAVDDIATGAIIGVEDGTTAETYARTRMDTSEIRAYSTAGEAADALFNSEVDAVIASGSAAEAAIEDRENLVVVDVIPTREAYGIVLPEDNDGLRKAVNSALSELKQDETLTDLYEEYFGVEAPARVATPISGPR
jgi:polar amino acid transport system substrate-binding protein